MTSLPTEFILGFALGVLSVLASVFVVGWSLTRIMRLPSPLGREVSPTLAPALPMVLTNDAKEAAIERQTLLPYIDNPEGIGR
jgi:hypothetical protein